MLSDSRIVAHFFARALDNAIRTFAEPRSHRELAHALRNVRNTSGHKAARLVLAQLSARNLEMAR